MGPKISKPVGTHSGLNGGGTWSMIVGEDHPDPFRSLRAQLSLGIPFSQTRCGSCCSLQQARSGRGGYGHK
ncbi:hypothetical protein, partial [Taibaiella koreensis]|uniref:hypothetical protein n=1 Tax=Taibaiella koreensis TaxID=1268548 RepID=UPI0013C31353